MEGFRKPAGDSAGLDPDAALLQALSRQIRILCWRCSLPLLLLNFLGPRACHGHGVQALLGLRASDAALVWTLYCSSLNVRL